MLDIFCRFCHFLPFFVNPLQYIHVVEACLQSRYPYV